MVDEVVYSRHRVGVTFGNCVESSVIYTCAKRPVLFFNEDCSISLSYACSRRYSGSLIGDAAPTLIVCSIIVVRPGSLRSTSGNRYNISLIAYFRSGSKGVVSGILGNSSIVSLRISTTIILCNRLTVSTIRPDYNEPYKSKN